jgi:hypothetical protein
MAQWEIGKKAVRAKSLRFEVNRVNAAGVKPSKDRISR